MEKPLPDALLKSDRTPTGMLPPVGLRWRFWTEIQDLVIDTTFLDLASFIGFILIFSNHT